jgi:hypothetical protein
MVPSSVITVAADSESLTCGGFSLCDTILLGNLDFIANYFSSLSLFPRRGDAGTAFMGSTRSGKPTPRQAMIEDFTEEFLMTLSGEGSFGLPSPRRRGMGASLTPIKTTQRMENALAAQAMAMVPLRTIVPQPETGLPIE